MSTRVIFRKGQHCHAPKDRSSSQLKTNEAHDSQCRYAYQFFFFLFFLVLFSLPSKENNFGWMICEVCMETVTRLTGENSQGRYVDYSDYSTRAPAFLGLFKLFVHEHPSHQSCQSRTCSQ